MIATVCFSCNLVFCVVFCPLYSFLCALPLLINCMLGCFCIHHVWLSNTLYFMARRSLCAKNVTYFNKCWFVFCLCLSDWLVIQGVYNSWESSGIWLSLLENLLLSCWVCIIQMKKISKKIIVKYLSMCMGPSFFALHLQIFHTSYMHLILYGLSYHCACNTDQARVKFYWNFVKMCPGNLLGKFC